MSLSAFSDASTGRVKKSPARGLELSVQEAVLLVPKPWGRGEGLSQPLSQAPQPP